MLTSAHWLSERLDSTGICTADKDVMRDCDPGAAMTCINELGTTLMAGSQEDRLACT